ncbi:hypothetical protein JB92DRAFT_2688750, partial [Gautieria morchelliformis]
IGGTASGSFLVEKTPVTSSQPIITPVLEGPPSLPDPDWSLLTLPSTPDWGSRAKLSSQIKELSESLSLAQKHIHACNSIIEGTHAQLVIQNLHLSKLQQVLQTKENKKKTDRTKLFPQGKGRHLTAETFIQALEMAEKVKKDGVREKEQRKEQRVANKEAKAAAEAEWKSICERHELAVKEWQVRCEELTAQDCPKKDFPKKPIRPLKPKPIPAASRSAAVLESDIDSSDSELET